MIDVKDISGNIRFSTPVNIGAKGKFSLMKEDYIVIPFSVSSPVSFKIGDYADLSGVLDESLGGKLSKIYEITEAQKPIPNKENGGYDYKLRLDAYYMKWKNKIFKYLPEDHSQEASWSLTASLSVHLDVFLRNLNSLKYKYRGSNFQYSIDAIVSAQAITLTYSNTNMLDALTMMAEALKCEWWITDNIIHFGRCEFGNPINIELFKEASDMTRSESKGLYATRIYAFGSEKNIPTNYRPTSEGVVVNGIVQRRLMLPEGTPYLDAYPNMTEEEAIEAVVTFDVFPHRVGTISDVTSYQSTVDNEDGTQSTETFYRYKDTELNFSKEYILEGQELKVTFESGLMNGMTFGAIFNPTGNDAKQWEIVQNDDHGRKLPDDIIKPQNGDKYVLSGYDTKFVSVDMLPQAENELLEKATEYLNRAKINDDTFTVPLYSSWVEEDKINRTFDVGQKINLINPAFFDNGRVSRVIGWELNLDIPYDTPTYIVGESPAYSRLGNLEEKIDSLTFRGQTFGGVGGTSSGNGVYVIRTNDLTAPSDSNVLSALKSLSMFHRKDKTDETQYLQKFLKGVEIGKYTPGQLGSGAAITIDEQGKSHAEFDFLSIRREGLFTEVSIQDAKHVGGELVVSPAAMVVSDVEELAGGWKLYFLQQDTQGRKIINEFEAGDQARCKTYNLQMQANGQKGNHYWWRLVTNVGENYIIVSKTDMDVNSQAPAIGDNVTLLGSRTDTRRQSAQVISAYGDNAPSRIMYQGIDSYDLTDKIVKAEYYDITTNRIKSITYGDAYVGARDGGSYLSFTADQGLRVRGQVEITAGSKGWQNIEGLEKSIDDKIGNIQVGDVQIGAENLLLNTGFTGNYLPKQMDGVQLDGKSEMYSDKLQYWSGSAKVNRDPDSVSGYSAKVSNLTQSTILISNEKYTVSFKAKGLSLNVSINRQTVVFFLTSEYKRYTCTFNGEHNADFEIRGDATICEIKLERGSVATDWCPARQDANPVADQFKKFWYLADALAATTKVDGGLILTSIVRIGQWQDGQLQKVNGCLSGIYNDDSDVAFSAGGDLDKAIYTVSLYRNNPMYQPTKEELKNIANVVVTHGGRAILNDVILRGYVYAEGGVFRGTVYAEDGEFKGKVTATSGEFRGTVYAESGEFRGTVYADSGEFNGTVNASGGTFNNIISNGGVFNNMTSTNGEFENMISVGGTFTNISSTNGTFTDMTATGGTFTNITATGGTFTQGSFENITLKKSINTSADNLYIDATGKVFVKDITSTGGNFTNITAEGGTFKNVTIEGLNVESISLNKNVNSPSDNLYIDANGNVIVKDITSTGGTFESINVTSGTFKGDIILGEGVTKLSSDGTAYFGKYGGNSPYLNITSTGAEFKGDVTLGNGLTKLSSDGTAYFGHQTDHNLFEITDTYGKFGRDIYIHSSTISTQSKEGFVEIDGETHFELSKNYFLYTSGLNTLKVCPQYQEDLGGTPQEGVLTIKANGSNRSRALYVPYGEARFDGGVHVDGGMYAKGDSNDPVQLEGVVEINKETHTNFSAQAYNFHAHELHSHGLYLHVTEPYSNYYTLQEEDDLIVWNSSGRGVTLTLPTSNVKEGRMVYLKAINGWITLSTSGNYIVNAPGGMKNSVTIDLNTCFVMFTGTYWIVGYCG